MRGTTVNTIDELFDRLKADPLSATAKDIDQVIAHYREARKTWKPGQRAKPEAKIPDTVIKALLPQQAAGFTRRF